MVGFRTARKEVFASHDQPQRCPDPSRRGPRDDAERVHQEARRPLDCRVFGGKGLHASSSARLGSRRRRATGEPRRAIYIVSNDTLVESPLVIRHLHQTLAVIRGAIQRAGLPITVKVTQPCIDQTFWVNVIGRGYIPPTRNFRWCTDRMKIIPTNDLIRQLTLAHQRAMLLVGTRKSESQTRGRADERARRHPDDMNPHSSIANCRMFAPLADLPR